MTPKIKAVTARPILDSRGDWTIEATLELENNVRATAAVPTGKSRGQNEASTVSVNDAVSNIEQIISPAVMGLLVEEQVVLDERLIQIDGTANKSRLGANALLAVSLAAARAAASAQSVPLWRHLNQLANHPRPQFPKLLVNMINGGEHSGSNLKIQEYLMMAQTNNPQQSVDLAQKFYQSLKKIVGQKLGRAALKVGDEGGLAPDLDNPAAPLELLTEVASELTAAEQVEFNFGIDAAANNLTWSPTEASQIYDDLLKHYRLTYIEDPFAETQVEAFTTFTSAHRSIMVVGDDLTVTNPRLITDDKIKNSVSGVIIKPNQIGTLTETLTACAAARKNNWQIFVSHRSGETNDDFIVDLAYAVGADGLKLGAPCRGERVAKYNRLLAIAGS